MNDNINPSDRQGKIELIASQRLSVNGELYKVVDFLNKNLKGHRLMFGLTKKEDKMVISVYEVE
ncbi:MULTISPECIES: YpmA family protein [Desulfosporosinus]|uniref:YpmA family protein n=1 Tax=Desulfosporosinus nitroreducens TaxID=2018668 RepID=A0ABT8QLL6_9FIRM|nr:MULTISPECIES: YpmA family protein [Desulfosporosinus]MCO1600361.1 YpmA family protein [Desulfosporosinus nitroreducens]MCO5386739.1 YpmA family protein [Desulfosporosinus sp.]MDA8222808.1 YpmA family protein [Desulfitobacterium hafniense]MDO0821449.1 YpmA family protein [Desulfosporosinus nitroreducens]